MGKKGKKVVFRDFYETTGREFQAKCYKWLSFLFPDIKDTVDLGEIDREGIDLYILARSEFTYSKTFQCKGFEKGFGEKQLKQCKNSIDTFLKSTSITDEYFLIINHELNSPFDSQLQSYLNKIVTAKKAKKTYLLTAQRFLKYYNEEFQKLMLEAITISNGKFYDSYRVKMDQKFYIEGVPFSFKGNPDISPINFIWKNCITSNSNKEHLKTHEFESDYFFLISEFGFGKTTLLLNLFEKSLKEKYIPIYIPVSVLGSEAFSNTSSLSKEIFKIIFDYDFYEKKDIVKFAGEAITRLLRSNPRIILLFDGLDEHLHLYKLQALKDLFNSAIDLKSTIIFSLRKSFYEERNYDFQIALSNHRNLKYNIFLTEWETSHIVVYVETYLMVMFNRLSETAKRQVQQFKELIINDDYEIYYGDIPKRPLFLEMILQDIISGEIKKRTISELYLNYFLEKFERDLIGQFDKFSPQREIPEFSVDYLKQVLIEIHESAARCCLQNEGFDNGEDAILENNIHEREIRIRLAQYGLSHDIGKFIAISVLNPISKRGNMNMRLRFAHKSFMEYFIARVICRELLSDTSSMFGVFSYYSRYSYPDAVLNFLGSCIDSEIRNTGVSDTFKAILQRKVNENGSKSNRTYQYLVKKFGLVEYKGDAMERRDNLPF